MQRQIPVFTAGDAASRVVDNPMHLRYGCMDGKDPKGIDGPIDRREADVKIAPNVFKSGNAGHDSLRAGDFR